MMLHPRRGFGRLGQCADGTFDCLVPGTNPGSTAVPSSGFDQTVASVDTSAQNALQDMINAMTPAQFQAYQSANTPQLPGTSSQPFQWGALLMALGGFAVVIMIMPKSNR
jgi:hypothetical protein